MESINDNFSKGFFGISQASRDHLIEISKWAKFLAIIGFIGIGLIVLAGIFMGSIGNLVESRTMMDGGSSFPGGLLTFIYLIMAGIYFFPVYYLFRFSVKMPQALGAADNVGFDEATGYLKSHYKYMGIMMIIVLSLYALVIVGVIIMALASR